MRKGSSLSNLGALRSAKRGARNPKVVKFTVRIDETTNRKLEVLADATGQNKTSLAAFAMAVGLNKMSDFMGRSEEVTLEDVDMGRMPDEDED